MNLENGILHIDSNLDNLELEKLSIEIKENLEQINEVTIDLKSIVATSGLFSLLVSIKKAKNEISIPLLENDVGIESLGNVTIVFKE